MHSDLVELGWTEEQWNRIANTVTEEAQKARVAAQMLPLVGPEEPSTVAVPAFTLGTDSNPDPFPPAGGQPEKRLTVDSDPTLFLNTIAVNVPLRTHEAADLDLKAALVMFRRAANYVARIEDSLVFNGRSPGTPLSAVGVPPVFTVTGKDTLAGIFGSTPPRIPPPPPSPPANGNDVVQQIVAAIGLLEAAGQFGPYACALSDSLFNFICTPTPNMIMPRDRVLPFLQGPLLRSSAMPADKGAVVALSGNPVELIVASDIGVRFLQTTLEPRFVFRVSERVALRIKEHKAIAILG